MNPSNLVKGPYNPRESKGEKAFSILLDLEGVKYQREAKLIEGRKFRVDFLLPDKVVVEIEGGHWVKSRHGYGKGFEKDLEKRNLITLAGYRTYFFTTQQAESGEAMAWLKENVL